MSRTVGFFNPECPYTIGNAELQSESPSISYQRSQALDCHGDESESHIYGGRETQNFSFKGTGTGDFTGLSVGTIATQGNKKFHMDSVAASWSTTDLPDLTISAHAHEDGDSHDSPHNTATPSIDLPAQFGTCAWNTLLGLNADKSVSSVSYNLGLTHEEANGCAGVAVASQNRDAVETLTIEFVGIVDVSVLTGSGKPFYGWDVTSANPGSKGNTAAETSSYTLEHHIAINGGSGASSASSES